MLLFSEYMKQKSVIITGNIFSGIKKSNHVGIQEQELSKFDQKQYMIRNEKNKISIKYMTMQVIYFLITSGIGNMSNICL